MKVSPPVIVRIQTLNLVVVLAIGMSVLINNIADSKQLRFNSTWLQSFEEIGKLQREGDKPFTQRSPRELYGIAEAFIHGGQGGFSIELIKSLEAKAKTVSDKLMVSRYFLQLGLNAQAVRAVDEAQMFCPCNVADKTRIEIFSDLVNQFISQKINAVEEPGRASEAAKHLLKFASSSTLSNLSSKKKTSPKN